MFKSLFSRPIIYAVLLFFSLSYTVIAFAAVSGNPKVIQLVEVSSFAKDTLNISWLATTDDNTLQKNLVYRVYLSKSADFLPDSKTLKLEKIGVTSVSIHNLEPDTAYFVLITATDKDGKVSWSNLLSGKTMAFNAQRTTVKVHELSNAQIAKAATLFKTGDYLVSRENGGMLRKINSSAKATNHGALNELFSELAFSSTIQLHNLPAQNIGVQKTANSIAKVTWQETGLTLTDSETKSTFRAMKTENLTGTIRTLTTIYSRVSAPVSVGVEANSPNQWKADIYVPYTKAPNEEFCDARLISFTHPDSAKNNLAKPTLALVGDKASDGVYRQIQALVNWTPTTENVDLAGRPYTAKIRVFVDDKGDGCNGDSRVAFWAETVDIEVPVYVTQGAPDDSATDKALNFEGDFKVSNKMGYNIAPQLVIGASISRAKLQTADLKMVADLSFTNELTITATGEATLNKTIPVLAEKSFTKVFIAGGVPIVVSGKFKIDAQITGNVTGNAELKKLLELKFPATEFGLVYRNGAWQPVQKINPSYTFQIEGEADANAQLTLTLIPDMQVSFYDAATGRLIVEPYVYAEAGIHGQFNYLLDGGDQPLTDADYWFTQLEAGAGANAKLFAGLSIFDYNIASYPENTTIDQISKFKGITLLKETPMATLPTLTAVVQNSGLTLPQNSDSRSMLISGVAKDYVAPVLNSSIIQFEKWTQPTLLTTTTGAQLLPVANTSGSYWFTYSKPGTYTVRLAGYDNLGAFVRQVVETTITLTDADNDGMIDQWEQRYGVTEPNADDDGDGVSNLAEFKQGYQPDNAQSQPFTVSGTVDNQQLLLTWTAVTGASNYRVCRASVTIVDVNNCLSYAGGFLQSTSNLALTLSGLVNGTKYYVAVATQDATGTVRMSNVLALTPKKPAVVANTNRLNDTGITTCSNASQNGLTCPVDGYPAQDAQFGRDKTTNNDSDGHAGFSFTKISSTGTALAATATSWNCVKDNVTGLMWENKTDDGGLHDKDWYYTWYNPDAASNGGYAGTQNGGSCGGTSQCDTAAYVKAVNAAGWCGFKDWRLPSKEELYSIVDYSRYNPSIDAAYFPNTVSTWFWSSSPSASNSSYAWIVYFGNGNGSYDYKNDYYAVRLVRGGQ